MIVHHLMEGSLFGNTGAWGNNSGWAVAVIGLLEQGSRS
ncbi:unnamed protein product [Brassica oleracea var. botrytis]|uniref:Uncharacterized protein n=2 Tax=Brassica TaxID=3705 RepID=A0A3P6A927_BRAOL|nr:unnamed protein product [Brassica napus]CDY44219.1 BnaC03g24110D [Brassica napus]VDC90236.1 unnamed protein product [Brassica oleracea]